MGKVMQGAEAMVYYHLNGQPKRQRCRLTSDDHQGEAVQVLADLCGCDARQIVISNIDLIQPPPKRPAKPAAPAPQITREQMKEIAAAVIAGLQPQINDMVNAAVAAALAAAQQPAPAPEANPAEMSTEPTERPPRPKK